MYYKKVKKLVPWCKSCNSEIQGNGSLVLPYKCICSNWEFNNDINDYVPKKVVHRTIFISTK